MKIIIIISLFVGIAFLSACDFSPVKTNRDGCSCDSITMDLPRGDSDLMTSQYRDIQEGNKYLRQEDLSKGFDSIRVRVIYYWGLDSLQFIDFYKSDKKWEGFYTVIDLNGHIQIDSLSVINAQWKKIMPESGWENFTSTLFSKQILSLPNFKEIEDKGIVTVGYGSAVWVEIATKCNYRLYSYSFLNLNKHYPEVQKMYNIIDYLTKEFGVIPLEPF